MIPMDSKVPAAVGSGTSDPVTLDALPTCGTDSSRRLHHHSTTSHPHAALETVETMVSASCNSCRQAPRHVKRPALRCKGISLRRHAWRSRRARLAPPLSPATGESVGHLYKAGGVWRVDVGCRVAADGWERRSGQCDPRQAGDRRQHQELPAAAHPGFASEKSQKVPVKLDMDLVCIAITQL